MTIPWLSQVQQPALLAAPMAAITHSAFRRLLADYGGYDALWTEMLSAKMILREDLERSPWLKRRPQEGRVIYQLLVSDTDRLPEILDRLLVLAPDGLDLNTACSAPNVRQLGGGSDLFDDPERLRGILRVMRHEWNGPLLVKIRLGWQRDDWRDVLRSRLALFEDEGVDAVSLHARFREERYGRPARDEVYAEVAAMTRRPLIASGDVMSRVHFEERRDAFAPVSGIMLGRVLAARPWSFGLWRDPELRVDLCEVWLRLCDYLMDDFEPAHALIRLKVFTPYFARNFAFGHTLFKTVQNAPEFVAAREAGWRFVEANQGALRELSLCGV